MTSLVERDREVGELGGLVDAVRAGEGRAALTEGPAGTALGAT